MQKITDTLQISKDGTERIKKETSDLKDEK
jgi:hypothetical protein